MAQVQYDKRGPRRPSADEMMNRVSSLQLTTNCLPGLPDHTHFCFIAAKESRREEESIQELSDGLSRSISSKDQLLNYRRQRLS
jgi:hypothetical protein